MKNLIVTTRARNGRRKDTTYAIEDDVANDPIRRANTISTIMAGEMNSVVNWRIEEQPK